MFRKVNQQPNQSNRLSWFCSKKVGVFIVVMSALSLVFSLSACEEPSGESSSTEVPDEGRGALLSALRHQVLLPLLREVKVSAEEFESTVQSESISESQAAWTELMLDWQSLEVLQIGPAGVSGLRIGGEDLRDKIYAFPLHNSCRVDQELVKESFDQPDWSENRSINVMGLDALERLLFMEPSASACPESSKLIRDGEWASFHSDTERAEASRWRYIKSITTLLKADIETLLSRWEGAFGDLFEQAQSPFSSQREAVDQIFAGIYYLDEVIKDLKIGAPAGIYMTCLETSCPEQLEHKESGISAQALSRNLKSILAIFNGSVETTIDPNHVHGLSSLLKREGATELAEELTSRIESLMQNVDMISSLETTLNEDPTMLATLHTDLKALCDLMKTQMVTVLNLSVPQEGAGDND